MWITPSRDKTLAELLAEAQIHGGGGISAALLQQPRNQYLDALNQVAPVIRDYIQRKKSDDIANQLLRDTGAPQQYQDKGALGLQAWNQLHQFQQDQPDTVMDDLGYRRALADTTRAEWLAEHPDQNIRGEQRVPIILPDGSTAYVTGNAALDYYTRGAGRQSGAMSEVPGVPQSVYKNSMKNRPYNPKPAFQNNEASRAYQEIQQQQLPAPDLPPLQPEPSGAPQITDLKELAKRALNDPEATEEQKKAARKILGL